MISTKCQTCAGSFTAYTTQKRKFCSRVCFHKSRRVTRLGKCKECQKTFEHRTPSGGIAIKTFCSRSCAITHTTRNRPPAVRTPEWCQAISRGLKGNRSSGWRGGVTPEHTIIRHSAEYREWRNHVFQRDDYTCQACGKRGGELNADHEFPFALFPALRFEVLNGRTLCKPCHQKTESYGQHRDKIRARWLAVDYEHLIT